MLKKRLLMLFLILSVHVFSQQTLIVGTYTKTCKSSGVYIYQIDKNFETIKLVPQSDSIANASFLSLSKDGNRLYTLSENGAKSHILTHRFNNETGKLSFLDSKSSAGANPCHIIEDDKNVIIANYSGGNIVVFSKTENGLSPAKQVVQHQGKSVNEKRQEAPHVHGLSFSADHKYILVADLGNDTVTVYNYNKDSNNPLNVYQTTKMDAGSGPRHLVISKNGKQVYVLNELTSTITAFNFKEGKLTKTSQVETLDKNFNGKNGAAEILLSRDGKFLYASDRGDVNMISVFAISKKGILSFVEKVSTLGKGPRNFTIDNTGNYLLVGNQYSNEIVIFHRDKKSGKLRDSNKRISVCAPVCLLIANK